MVLVEIWLFNYAFDYKCFKVIVNKSVSGQIQTRKLKCLKVTSAKTMINSESEEAETQFKIFFYFRGDSGSILDFHIPSTFKFVATW